MQEIYLTEDDCHEFINLNDGFFCPITGGSLPIDYQYIELIKKSDLPETVVAILETDDLNVAVFFNDDSEDKYFSMLSSLEDKAFNEENFEFNFIEELLKYDVFNWEVILLHTDRAIFVLDPMKTYPKDLL